MEVFFDIVSIYLLHECFIKQACKSHFTIDLENTQNLRDNKGQNWCAMLIRVVFVTCHVAQSCSP